VRRVLRWTLVLLPATVLSVWLVPRLVTESPYSLTCCTQADINRPWQPGTTVDLHWTVESQSGANLLDRVFDKFENPTHKVFVTAFLSGPYSDLAGLKQIIRTCPCPAGDHSVQGSVIAMDDRTRPPTTPVTTFVLPADLPPGYYDLTLIWEDANGGTGDSHNIVRVGTQ
jgi:hypothetical protein